VASIRHQLTTERWPFRDRRHSFKRTDAIGAEMILQSVR